MAKVFKNNERFWIITLASVAFLLLTLILIVITNSIESEKEIFEIVYTPKNIEYEFLGKINSEEKYTYELPETGVEFIKRYTKEVGDKISEGELLFSYKKTNIGNEEINVEVLADNSGVVLEALDDSVKIRRGTYISLPSYEGIMENQCIVLAGEETYEIGNVTNITSVLNYIPREYLFTESKDIDVLFTDLINGEEVNCEDLEFDLETKEIVLNQEIVSKEEKTGHLNIMVDTIKNNIEDEIITIEENDYIGKRSMLLVQKDDIILAGDSLFLNTYSPYSSEIIEKRTEINGVILDDDVTILSTDANCFEFKIDLEDLKVISEGDDVVIEIDGLKIISEIDSIIEAENEYKAKVINPNFTKIDLEKEGTITVIGALEDLILVPKKYVENSKVIKVVDKKRIETLVEYTVYDNDYYLIEEGLNLGDMIEEFN